jgi:hypothetical protein
VNNLWPLCIFEARKGIVWWKIDVWRVKGLARTMNWRFVPHVANKKTGAAY